jgi:hypothetical protein
MKVVKQRFARMVHKKRSSTQMDLWADDESEHVWQKRFYDFNVWTNASGWRSCGTCTAIP